MSELYLPNIFCRTYIESLSELIGKNGLQTCLRMANLEVWIEAYPPPNMDKEIDFLQYARLNQTLEDLYGEKGGQSLARQAGWAVYQLSIHPISSYQSAISGIKPDDPTPDKVVQLFSTLSDTLAEISDIDSGIEQVENEVHFTITKCPHCWGRQSESPICYSLVGILDHALQLTLESQVTTLLEQKCIALGDEGCRFIWSLD